MATVIIPLNSSPNQTFSCKVPKGSENISLSFEISFNEVSTYWLMNILREGSYLLSNIPLVPGDSPSGNILGQYEYLGIGSAYVIAVTDVGDSEWPYVNTLGSNWVLVWSDST